MVELKIVDVKINNTAYQSEYGSSSSWTGACCYKD